MVQSIFQFSLSIYLFFHWTEIYCADFRMRYEILAEYKNLVLLRLRQGYQIKISTNPSRGSELRHEVKNETSF